MSKLDKLGKPERKFVFTGRTDMRYVAAIAKYYRMEGVRMPRSHSELLHHIVGHVYMSLVADGKVPVVKTQTEAYDILQEFGLEPQRGSASFNEVMKLVAEEEDYRMRFELETAATKSPEQLIADLKAAGGVKDVEEAAKEEEQKEKDKIAAAYPGRRDGESIEEWGERMEQLQQRAGEES